MKDLRDLKDLTIHAVNFQLHLAEMCSGSEADSYLRLIDFVYHSTLGLRVIKKEQGASRSLTPGIFRGLGLGIKV